MIGWGTPAFRKHPFEGNPWDIEPPIGSPNSNRCILRIFIVQWDVIEGEFMGYPKKQAIWDMMRKFNDSSMIVQWDMI